MTSSPPWSVYLIRCRDGSLYTGITLNVGRRLAQHHAGKGAKYLRGRGPLTLVLQRTIGEKGAALRLERAIKSLSRREKEAMLRRPAGVRELMKALAAR